MSDLDDLPTKDNMMRYLGSRLYKQQLEEYYSDDYDYRTVYTGSSGYYRYPYRRYHRRPGYGRPEHPIAPVLPGRSVQQPAVPAPEAPGGRYQVY